MPEIRWLPEADAVTIPSTGRDGRLRASPAQRRLWFSEHLGRRGLEFVFPYALRLGGHLDVPALSRALDAVVQRHESLRTTFSAVDGEPYQVVREHVPFDLQAVAVPGESREDREPALTELLHEVVRQPFDLVRGPILRARLFRLSDTEHVLLVVVHHIATDGWSMDILFRELTHHYTGQPPLPPLPIQYADYAEWQLRQLETGAHDDDLTYWRQQLTGAPPVITLPTDRPRPARQSFRGDWITFDVPAHVRSAVEAVARERGASSFMVLMAAFQLTLARWSGHSDILVGTPVLNRPLPETEALIGFFVNLLPIRTRIDESETFGELLDRVRDTLLDAYEHQEVSFDRIVESVRPGRTLACNPIFQVTLAKESAEPVTLPGLTVEPVDARPDITRYDLAFDYWDTPGGGWQFDAYYATDMFDRGTVQRLATRLVDLLVAVIRPAGVPLARVWTAWDATPAVDTRATPAAVAIDPVDLFRQAVTRHPDRPAVLAEDGELTFAELDARSAALAAALTERGLGPGSVVGVCLPRRLDLLVALLAVWRAGAAYLPLDPAYPVERLRLLVTGSRAAAVVTDRDQGFLPGDVTALDAGASGHGAYDPVVPGAELAYVIHTSGSTGEPKGVAVTRGGVAALLAGLEQEGVFPAQPRRVAWNASASFDASVQQWARVCRGDTVVLLSSEVRFEPDQLADLIDRYEVTDLDVTPSHWQTLREAVTSRTRGRVLNLLIGGEAIPAELWTQLSEDTDAGLLSAVNLYGPTECTVDATTTVIRGAEPHIGMPLPGVRAYVLDPLLRPVASGATGELVLAGPGVARGYLHRPGRTARSFVPDTVAGDGSRMYRTGDRVRLRPDGNLDFLGRQDDQVKIRGFRVELGEVESALRACPGVRAAVAAVHTDASGTTSLVGYHVSDPGVASAEVIDRLRDRLPEHMVPTVLVPVTEMPLTASGKVDRDRLPAPGLVSAGDPGYIAPDGPVEELIAEVWAEVLNLDRVGATDDFFDLGGHSLLAIRVVARVKKRMKLTLPTTVVFERPRLRDLAGYITEAIQQQLARQS
ncbi:amino acid adenylation domain-containing protein [Actinoplanes philippinensis]|uniref:amino acid adenylation domain-containing protein n=1 Tax=Actinoplanes philippinensis TaxID=35752 RepID=UPI0033CB1086